MSVVGERPARVVGRALVRHDALEKVAGRTRYAADFFDVTQGNNALFAPTIPGYFASPGWDAVTGLGTPNAAALAPDLVAAIQGH